MIRRNKKQMFIVMALRAKVNDDPTRTLTLRRQYIAEVNKRFRKLKGEIRESIIDSDCFGLKNKFSALEPLRYKQFEFSRDAEKVDAFMRWLKEVQEEGIVEVVSVPDAGLGKHPWSSLFLRASYQRGIKDARSRLKQVIPEMPTFGEAQAGVYAVFDYPIHADRIALMYTRSYNELKGISEAMSQQISRVLAQGLIEGVGPYELARRINNRVTKIGITRARTLARTEMIQTYNTAALNEYEAAEQLIGKQILVRWLTARDARVRATHRPRESVIYDRKVAEVMLGEPNCRGALLPYIPDVQGAVERVGRGEYRVVGKRT